MGLMNITNAAPVKKPAAAKKPTATKPTAKPATKQRKLIREVLGTEQLQGYEGSFGETFTLGKQMPLNFTLRKAEYSVSRANIGGTAYFPKGDEKLLVLRYTVQNPQKQPFNYSTSYLTFKAVDANGVTRNYVGDIAREVTGEPLRLTLNPGQKVDGYTVIKVAAYGEVPKLIVGHGYETTTPIIRYDLRDRVAKLAAPFADPEDAKGATRRKMVPAKAGEFYPVIDDCDARLDSVAYTTDSLQGRTPKKGRPFLHRHLHHQEQEPQARALQLLALARRPERRRRRKGGLQQRDA
jgi:hypothetical protein